MLIPEQVQESKAGWRHLALTAGETVKLYIDGKVIAATDSSIELTRGDESVLVLGQV